MLFAAGLGTRLFPLTEHKPKALVDIAGKTLLQRNIDLLVSQGINHIIINVHHHSEQIITYVKKLNLPGVEFHISDESEMLLDTGGGLKKASHFFKDEASFLVMNADVVTNINIKELMLVHQKSGAVATLAVRNRTTGRSFLFNNQQLLCGWQDIKKGALRKVRPDTPLHPLAFSGIQLVSPSIFNYFPDKDIFSLVDLYLESARIENIFAYVHDTDYWFDAGSIEKIGEIEEFLKNNISNPI